MEWRTIPRYPCYEISEKGDIRRLTSASNRPAGTMLAPSFNSHGYLRTQLRHEDTKRTEKIHTLVCEAFHGPKPYPNAQVNHRDDNKINNHYSNLYWGNSLENAQDRIRNGNHKKQGKKCQVEIIRLTGTAKDIVDALKELGLLGQGEKK